MPPEDNPADETPLTRPEYERGERDLLSPGPWELWDKVETLPGGVVVSTCEITAGGKIIATVRERRADAMAMRAAAEWWDALTEIAFGSESATADELRGLARNALGKR